MTRSRTNLPFAGRLGVVVGTLVVLSCIGDSAGPGVPRRGMLAIAPTFQSSAAPIVAFNAVRIRLQRLPPSTAFVLDTTIPIPSPTDTVDVSLPVPLNSSSETFLLYVALINAAGDTVFRNTPYPDSVTVSAGAAATPETVPIAYTGVGANAALVEITSPAGRSLITGDTVQLTAVARDSQGNEIAGTPIAWASLDTTRARVPDPALSTVLGGNQRGTARIEARLLTGQRDTTTVQVFLPAVAIAADTSPPSTLPASSTTRVVARVTAVDGLGVANVPVQFAVTAGAGSLSQPADTTDSTGRAGVTWTLGAGTGTQSVQATRAGLSGSPVTFSTSAIASGPDHLVFSVQPGNATAGVAITPAIQVTVQDAGNNTVTSFSGSVFIAIGTNPTSDGILSGTNTRPVTNGVATFDDLSIDLAAPGYTLVASAVGVPTGATSAAFTITPGPPALLTSWTGNNQIGAGGAQLAESLVVRVTDGFSNGVPGVTVTWTIVSGAGSLSAATTSTDAGGLAYVFWTLGASAGTHQAHATVAGISGSPVLFEATAIPAGTTKTWTGGFGADWANPGNWNPSGVPAGTDNVFVPATGNDPVLSASQSVSALTVEAGVIVLVPAGDTLTVSGSLDASSATIGGAGLVQMVGTGVQIFGGTLPSLRITGTVQTTTLTVNGDLTISVGNLTIGPTAVTVNGNFSTTATGTLTMLASGAELIVSGDVTFAGGSEAGLLGAAGPIQVGGDFSQLAGTSPQSFAPTSTQVWLTGSGAQTITFATPGPSKFAALSVQTTADSLLLGSNLAASAVMVTSGVPIAGPGRRLSVFDGGLTTSGALRVDTLEISCGLNVTGPYAVPTTILIGGGNSPCDAPALPYQDLVVTGPWNLAGGSITGRLEIAAASAGLTLAGPLTVDGNLIINGDDSYLALGGATFVGGSAELGALGPSSNLSLIYNANPLTIAGNLTTGVSCACTLMTSSSDTLQVAGGATFAGSVNLSGGALFLGGDFNQVGGLFQPSGAHKLVFDGAGPQAVSFATPGPSARFQNVEVAKTGGTLTLVSPVVASGQLLSSGGAAPLVMGGGNSLSVAGLDVDGLVLDNVLLASTGGTITAFDNVTLQNYDPAAVQLTITHPGAPAPFAFNNTQFLTAPVAGRYLSVTDDNTGDGNVLTINMAGSQPANGSAFTLLAGGAVVNWAGLVFTQEPVNTAIGGVITPAVQVAAQDALGNIDTTFTSNVVVSLTGGPGILGGTLTKAAVAGIATFDDLNVDSVGAYQLVALADGFDPVTSSTFNVTPAGTTKQWLGSSTDWFDPANWSPNGVPTGSDNVFVGTSPNNPTITNNTAVNDLVVQAGAVLTVGGGFTLTAGGNLSAGSTIAGPGSVAMNGSGVTLSGTLPNLATTGNVTAAGATTVNGNLTVSAGTFNVGGQHVTVTGGVLVNTSGILAMQAPGDADTLEVLGGFGTTSGNPSTALTAGVMLLSGNFTQTAGSSQNFAASGTHKVVFNGASAQTASFTSPGATASRFQQLEVTNPAGLIFVNNATALGLVTLSGGAASGTITVTLTSGISDPTGGSRWQVANTTFSGVNPTLPDSLLSQVTFTTSATLVQDLRVVGNLTVSGGSFNLGGQNVTVTGNMALNTSGVLQMLAAGDGLTVQGNFSTISGNPSFLTAGTLDVRGNFTQTAGSSQNFPGSGTHRVVFSGTAPQTVSFTSPGSGASRFQNVEIGNAAGVNFTTAFTALGLVDLTNGPATGTGTATLFAGLVDLTGGSRWQLPNTILAGVNPALPDSLVSNVTVTANDSLAADLRVVGNLSVTGGTFVLGGQHLTVTGDVSISTSGILAMRAPGDADTLDVLGNFSATSGNTSTGLTAGVLRLAGSFTQTAGSSANFAASGTHKTVFVGSGPQTASFTSPSASFFQQLDIVNPAGVTFTGQWQAKGLVTLSGGPAMGTQTAFLTTGIGDPTGGARWLVQFTAFNGPNPVLPDSLVSTVAFGANATLTANLRVVGDLVISIGTFNLGGRHLTVTGNFSDSSVAVLAMQSTSDTLTILGNFSASSGNPSTGLTAGVMLVAGAFSQTAGSSQNFAASGTHKVVLNGTAVQPVSFTSPSATGSRFRDLVIANPAGVSFNTGAVVAGTATMSAGLAQGQDVEIGGNLIDPIGGWQPAGTIFSGTNPSLPDSIRSHVTFTANNTLAADLRIVGTRNLTVSGGTLNLGGQHLTVTGDMSIASSGILAMFAPADADTLEILGSFTTNTGSPNPSITGGVILLAGNFTQTAGSSQNFAAGGTHKVVLNGAASQAVSFSSPGPSASRFQVLEVSNSGTGVTLGNDVTVLGQLISPAGNSTVSGNRRLFISGLDVDGLTLDHVHLRSTGGTIAKFDNVAFTNFAAADTQFILTHPGTATPFTFNAVSFLSTPVAPGAYLRAVDNLADANVLTVNMVASIPVNGSSLTQLVGGALVNWSATQQAADITTNTTWTAAASPHEVSGFLKVRNGATLTIEDGAEVRFNAGAGLQVGDTALAESGGLVMSGTAGSILLTADTVTPSPGFWRGIEVQRLIAPTTWTNVDIEWGGSPHPGFPGPAPESCLLVANNTGATLTLDGVTMRHCVHANIHHFGGLLVIKRSTLDSATGSALHADFNATLEVDSTVFSNAGNEGLQISTPLVKLLPSEGNQILGNAQRSINIFAEQLPGLGRQAAISGNGFLTSVGDSILVNGGRADTTVGAFTIFSQPAPYLLPGFLEVGRSGPGGATVTLDSGLVMVFTGNAGFQVGDTSGSRRGQIRSLATVTSPTLIRARSPASPFGGLGLGLSAGPDSLRYVSVLHGGNGDMFGPQLAANIMVHASSGANPVHLESVIAASGPAHGITIVRNLGHASTKLLSSEMSSNQGSGLIVLMPDTVQLNPDSSFFGGNFIQSNLQYPVMLSAGALQALGAVSGTGNGRDTMFIVDGGMITRNAQLADFGRPWRVGGGMTVDSGATLNIPAGVEVAFDSVGFLVIGGSTFAADFQAEGTSALPVLLTGTPGHGDWFGIDFANIGPTSLVLNTVIERAGRPPFCPFQCEITDPGAGIRYSNASGNSLVFDTVTVRNSSIRALAVVPSGGSNLLIRGSQFYGIAFSPVINANDGTALTIVGSDLYGYGQMVLENQGGGTVSADGNWWGDVLGPLGGRTLDPLGRARFDGSVSVGAFATSPFFPSEIGPAARVLRADGGFSVSDSTGLAHVGATITAPDSLRVRVVDSAFRGVAGQTVSYTGPGTLSLGASVTTDAGGRAEGTSWITDIVAGPQAVVGRAVSVSSDSALWAADMAPGPTVAVNWQALQSLTPIGTVSADADSVTFTSSNHSSGLVTNARDQFGNVTQPTFLCFTDIPNVSCPQPYGVIDTLRIADTIRFTPTASSPSRYMLWASYDDGVFFDSVVININAVITGIAIDRDLATPNMQVTPDTFTFASACPTDPPNPFCQSQFAVYGLDSAGAAVVNSQARFRWLSPPPPDTAMIISFTRGPVSNDTAVVTARMNGVSWLVVEDTAQVGTSPTAGMRDSMPVIVTQTAFGVSVTPAPFLPFGDTVTFAGMAVDQGGSPMPSMAVNWRADSGYVGTLTIEDTTVAGQARVRLDSTVFGLAVLEAWACCGPAGPSDTLFGAGIVRNPIMETSLFLGSNPQNNAVHPVTGFVYTTTTAGVEVFNPVNRTSAATDVGPSANGIALNPANGRIYVSRGDKVMVLNDTTNALLDSIAVGTNLGRVAVDTIGNRVFVPAQSGSLHFLFVISGATNTVTDSVALADIGQGVAYNPTVDRVYVTLFGQAAVQVVDPTALTVVDSIPAGTFAGAGPNDVAVNPVTNRFYVTISNDQAVWVYDGSANTLITTISVGSNGFPSGIDVDVVRNKIYVARPVFGFPGGYVVVIDGTSNQVLQFIEPDFTSSDVAVHQATGTVSAARQSAVLQLYFYVKAPPVLAPPFRVGSR